jgi:hypothetical protein
LLHDWQGDSNTIKYCKLCGGCVDHLKNIQSIEVAKIVPICCGSKASCVTGGNTLPRCPSGPNPSTKTSVFPLVVKSSCKRYLSQVILRVYCTHW